MKTYEPNYEELFTCFDCKRVLEEKEEFMEYPVSESINKAKRLIKCKECHEKDPVLRNYQPTEVYSRVVGYIRPVKNWNPAKAQEFKDRVVFKVENICGDNC